MSLDVRERVLKLFDLYSDKKRHWKIYYGYSPTPSHLCASTEIHQDDLDKELSRKQLDENLSMLTPGEYMIQFKPTASANQNFITHRFEIKHAWQQQQGTTVIQPHVKGMMDPDYFEKLMTAKIAGVEANFRNQIAIEKIDSLTKEVKKLKEGRGNQSGEFMNGLKEIVAMLRGMSQTELPAQPQRIAIGAPGTVIKDVDRTAYFKRLGTATLNEIFVREGGNQMGIGLLFCLNEWIKENPEQFESVIKPTILKYADRLEMQPEPETEEEDNDGAN